MSKITDQALYTILVDPKLRAKIKGKALYTILVDPIKLRTKPFIRFLPLPALQLVQPTLTPTIPLAIAHPRLPSAKALPTPPAT